MDGMTSLVWAWCALLLLPLPSRSEVRRSEVRGSEGESGKLLLILLDGFRWDYVDTYAESLPNLRLLAKAGARANSVRPDFPTVSIPNHYTLMTGLHTDHHGMTGNFMYDYVNQTKFQLLTTPIGTRSQWWEGGTPLWLTAVNQGKRVSMYRWRGCEVEIRGARPTYCLPFSANVKTEDFDQSIEETFRHFKDNTTDIAGVYSDVVDLTGHWYGPDSRQVAAALRAVDLSVGKVMERWVEVMEEGVQVNVMIFSDHGMTGVSMERIINVTAALTSDLYDAIMESGPIMSVYTSSDSSGKKSYNIFRTLERLRKFPHMTCYTRDQLPRQWHYAGGRYVAPVTCVADPGWFILHPSQPVMWQRPSDGKLMEGEHGYPPDLPDMWAVFLGLGPAFIPGSTVPQLSAVDLYPVMCRLAGLQPGVYDGRGSNLNPLLQPGWKVNRAVRGVPGVCLIIVMAAIFVTRNFV